MGSKSSHSMYLQAMPPVKLKSGCNLQQWLVQMSCRLYHWGMGRCYQERASSGFVARSFGLSMELESIPHPVLGTTKDYCRYVQARIKALFTPYLVTFPVGGIDRTWNPKPTALRHVCRWHFGIREPSRLRVTPAGLRDAQS